MNDLRSHRGVLGISQSRLARLSGVSRFKICLFELGDGKLTDVEHAKLRAALQTEAERLRSLSTSINFGQPADTSVAAVAEVL